MYVAVVPNRNSPPAILLRESYREGRKVRTRTIANITSWEPQRIDALKRALKGEFDGCVDPKDITDRVFGTLFVTKQISEQLGISKALGNSTMGKLALFLVLARLAHQGSRLSAVRWAKNQAVAELLGLSDFDEDDLYDALDWLESSQSYIEKKLYRRYVNEHGEPPALVLYDVTSSYFEGQNNELAAYGYNRDKKKGKKQIVIGLLTAADGEPLAIRVFKGNTTDNTTVVDQINLLKEEFEIEEVVFIGDRGMVKSKQKQALRKEALQFITALTDAQVTKLIKDGVIDPELFDETLCELEHDSRRLVLRRNDAVVRKEFHRREDKIQRLETLVQQRNSFVQDSTKADPEAGLRRFEAWAKRYKLSSFVSLSLSDRMLCMQIDDARKTEDALLDGCYVLETNVDGSVFDTQTIDERYRDLQKVEADFRLMKTALLEVRPIFVRKASRTRGHVFVAMLALKLARAMRERLSSVFGTTDDDPHTVTLNDALDNLARWCLVRSTMGKASFLRIPQPDDQLSKILEALGVAPPNMCSLPAV